MGSRLELERKEVTDVVWIIFILFILQCIAAYEFQQIAKLKGYTGNRYLLYVLIFGIMGMLMVIALPNLRDVEEQKLLVQNRGSGVFDDIKLPEDEEAEEEK